MDCPACSHGLTAKKAGDITVDICINGCGGIWFDQLELERLDKSQDVQGQALLEVDVDPTVHVDQEKRRNCPLCPDQIMIRHFYSARRKVAIDECPECGGHWLDVGELAEIRQLYESHEERAEHFEQFIEEQFGVQIAAMKEAREEKKEAREARKEASRFSPLLLGFLLGRR